MSSFDIPTRSEHGQILKILCLPEKVKIYITKVYKDYALLTCCLILCHFTGQTSTTHYLTQTKQRKS